MRQFTKRLASEWRKLKLPRKENTAIIAVSGGADSVSLLASLHELQIAQKINLKLIVAHFNHHLRAAEGDDDAEFVKNLAAEFSLEFICGRPSSEIRQSAANLEQTARNWRYDFLRRAADNHGAFAVLTAHTLDDQAETFLLRLMRGSSADGLGSMETIRQMDFAIQPPQSNIQLIRPLLAWSRRTMTESYCRELGLKFRHDSMNDDENFARVRVRKQLLPLLKTFNPQIVEILANTANILREDAVELNVQAQRFLDETAFVLRTADCQLINAAVRRRILRLWLKRARGNLRQINTRHLSAVESLVLNQKGGRTIELPGGGIVKRSDGKLIFTSKVEKTGSDI